MKNYTTYIAYVYAREGRKAWSVSTNCKADARKFAREHGASSYALLFKYDVKRTPDIPGGYSAGRGDSWIRHPEWTDVVPEWFTEGMDEHDSKALLIHKKMEAEAEQVEL